MDESLRNKVFAAGVVVAVLMVGAALFWVGVELW